MQQLVPRLAWISDCPHMPWVGNARVAREFLHRLQPFYNVQCISFNADAVKVDNDEWNCVNVERDTSGVNKEQLLNALKEINPNIIVLSHDAFLFPFVDEIKALGLSNLQRVVGYFTIDGDPLPEYYGWKIFEKLDLIIVPTIYGKNVIKRQFKCNDVVVVPHGVNFNLFHGCDKNVEKTNLNNYLKTFPYQVIPDINDKQVFLYYGHNQERKQVYKLLKGWEQFQIKYPEKAKDCVLFCLAHTRIHNFYGVPVTGDYNLGLFNKVKNLFIFTEVVEDEILSLFVKGSDFLLHPATNEGFGLTILEAMACGTIPIICKYSGHTDFCTNDTSIGIRFDFDLIPVANCRKAVPSVDDIVNALWLASFSSPSVREAIISACVEMSKQFCWDDAARKFHIAIQRALYRIPRKFRAYYL